MDIILKDTGEQITITLEEFVKNRKKGYNADSIISKYRICLVICPCCFFKYDPTYISIENGKCISCHSCIPGEECQYLKKIKNKTTYPKKIEYNE